jgi:hypothetical protein
MSHQESSSPPSPMEGFSEEESNANEPELDTIHFDTGPAPVPFFADATLDLSEAHDIAETPEPQRRTLSGADKSGPTAFIELPSLTENSTSEHHVQSPESIASKKQNVANMARITSADVPSARSHPPTHRPRAPTRPRDLGWAVAWLLFVPTSLVWTSTMRSHNANPDDVKADSQVALCVFYALVLTYGATILLGRLFYRTMGGADGDDARHIASQVLLGFCPLSVMVYPILILVLYWKAPLVLWKYGWIPLLAGIREFFWALQHFRSRQTFFSALMVMALDILSRSLRRMSFARTIGLLMGLQLAMVVWWKLAVFGAWNSGRMVPFAVALIAGLWLTRTVARLLSLIAAGGVTAWFAQQSLMMEEMERMKASQEDRRNTSMESDDASADYNVAGYTAAVMPEEYRSADASAYQSVLDFDEGLDDDFEDEEEDNGPTRARRPTGDWTASSVKGFLFSGLSFSFGSVTQCALLGGIAQFVWTVVRNTEGVAYPVSQRFPSSSSQFGFRGMQIGSDGTGFVGKLLQYANVSARTFVRGHSDLAMSHVAAYYKSYQRAANDVAVLVDTSGTLCYGALPPFCVTSKSYSRPPHASYQFRSRILGT